MLLGAVVVFLFGESIRQLLILVLVLFLCLSSPPSSSASFSSSWPRYSDKENSPSVIFEEEHQEGKIGHHLTVEESEK